MGSFNLETKLSFPGILISYVLDNILPFPFFLSFFFFFFGTSTQILNILDHSSSIFHVKYDFSLVFPLCLFLYYIREIFLTIFLHCY